MIDDLPTRPFTALAPPPAGALVAVRAGRGIRRRRRLAEAGAAAASVALVAGVVAATGAGSTHAQDQLVPAHGTAATPAPSSPPRDVTRASTGNAAGVQSDASRPHPAAAPAPGHPAGAPQPESAPQNSGSSKSYRTPALRRAYAPPPPPPDPRFCEMSVADDPGGTHKRVDWCITADIAATDAGHDLALTVCRDRTTDAALTFGTTREADLVVSRAGRVVWRWSTGHTAATRPHALASPAGACWSWTAPWTDVDSSGRPLPSGRYDLGVTSLAKEVADLPNASAAFAIS
jgi:hypothetical protein